MYCGENIACHDPEDGTAAGEAAGCSEVDSVAVFSTSSVSGIGVGVGEGDEEEDVEGSTAAVAVEDMVVVVSEIRNPKAA